MDARELHTASVIERHPYNRGVDGRAWLDQPGHSSVAFDNGDVALVEDAGDGIFMVHWLFEKARGREAIDQAKLVLGKLFDDGALAVSGITPLEARAARIFNRWIGGRSLGEIDTPFGRCEKFIVTRQMWKAN